MNDTERDRYFARFRRVFEYVDAHLGDDLGLERLGRVAAFSKFHFHRQFSSLFGLSVFEYVQLQRLKRASFELAFRPKRSVLDVALDCGYEGPEAFARAFKRRIGQTPSAFRADPQWGPWHATFEVVRTMRTHTMKPIHRIEDVRILEFPATRVATLEHRGDPNRIGDSIRAFIAWRRANALPPARSATFNVFHDDPATTPPERYRMDLCAATDRPIAPNDAGIVAKTIPPGRCAVLRHVGSDDTLGETIRFLYAEWLPSSGAELRDFPVFCQRVTFYPDVPEGEAITDVFLPLK